jgi:hypothetical protein
VLYDYQVAAARPGESLTLTSPILDTHIDRVVRLAKADYGFVLRETLGLRSDTLDDPDGLGDLDGLEDLGGGAEFVPASGAPQKGANTWVAEVFLPWRTLGMSGPAAFRFDIGVLSRPKGKDGHLSAAYWANPAPPSIDVPAVQAMINPGAWGTLAKP